MQINSAGKKINMKSHIRRNTYCVLFGIAAFFLFIGSVLLGLNYQKAHVVSMNKQSLQILANDKAYLIDSYMKDQKDKLDIISSVGIFKEIVKEPNNVLKLEEAGKKMNEFKDMIPGIRILSSTGVVIIGEADIIGANHGTRSYFSLPGKKTAFERYYDPVRKKDYYAVIGPIYDSVEKNKIIGAISFDIELDKIGVLMKESLKNDASEVYLIDETGLLLSGSEYVDRGNRDGVLIQEIKSEGAKECLADLEKYKREGYVEEHAEDIPQYINYMGNEVFGAHSYATSIMGCVIAEESIGDIAKFSEMDYLLTVFGFKPK